MINTIEDLFSNKSGYLGPPQSRQCQSHIFCHFQITCCNFSSKNDIVSVHVEVYALTWGQNIVSKLGSLVGLGTFTTPTSVQTQYLNIGCQ